MKQQYLVGRRGCKEQIRAVPFRPWNFGAIPVVLLSCSMSFGPLRRYITLSPIQFQEKPVAVCVSRLYVIALSGWADLCTHAIPTFSGARDSFSSINNLGPDDILLACAWYSNVLDAVATPVLRTRITVKG